MLESLAVYGWKYFDLKNLNQVFFMKYRELVDQGEIDEIAAVDEQSKDEKEFFAATLHESIFEKDSDQSDDELAMTD